MDLRQALNDESNRLSNLLLGFSAATVAFGVHEVAGWTPGRAAVIAAAAGAAWAGSFIAGLIRAHAGYDALRFNGALSEAGRQHPRYGDFERDFALANRRSGKAYRGQRWLLLIGALLFAIAEGVRLWDQRNPANDARCLALQRDMLSAAPRKKDGPALFQAFGCRPQGEGSVMVLPTGDKAILGHPLHR